MSILSASSADTSSADGQVDGALAGPMRVTGERMDTLTYPWLWMEWNYKMEKQAGIFKILNVTFSKFSVDLYYNWPLNNVNVCPNQTEIYYS